MLVCAIDGHSRSLNLVLTVQREDGVPRPLDHRQLPRTASATALRDLFAEWESFGAGVELIVCNSADALSSDLLEAFHALARVEWVEEADLDEVLSAWEETIPLAGWLRGTMMALLAGVAPPSHQDWWLGGVGYHWLQAWFTSHLVEFEQRNAVRGLAADENEALAGGAVLSRSEPLVKWRSVAREFHAIQTCCAAHQLPADFEPIHLTEFPRAALTPAVQGVFAFLLHIWNTEHPFELNEIQRWDRDHCGAFTAWVTGACTGVACEYF